MADVVALRLQLFFEMFGERVKLKGRKRRRDDEVVSEGCRPRDIDEDDVLRLAIREDIDRAVGQ